MNSKLFELSKNDIVESFVTSIFTSVSVSVGMALISSLQGISAIISSGSFSIDYKSILLNVLSAFFVGLITGFTAFLGSLLKRLNTNDNGEIKIGGIKLK